MLILSFIRMFCFSVLPCISSFYHNDGFITTIILTFLDVTLSFNPTSKSQCTADCNAQMYKRSEYSKEIYIGGLFDIEGCELKLLSEGRTLSYGLSEKVASQVAEKHVNDMDYLNGYKLTILYNDSKCDPGVGTDTLFDFIYRKPEIAMVMGSACSDVTKTLAEIVPNLDLILISYAATSPALSEREKYKTFYRLAPTDSAYNKARIQFIRHFNWKRVGMIHQNKETYDLAINGLSESLTNNNISVISSESFRSNDDIRPKLLALKAADVRIIFGGFNEDAFETVFCEAFKLNMYGPRHIWIMIGDIPGHRWMTNIKSLCSQEQLRQVTNRYFTVSSFNSSINRMSIANITTDNFIEDYVRLNGTFPVSPFATSSYDTVWTIAASLKANLLRLATTEQTWNKYQKEQTQTIMNHIAQSSFNGLSGPVSFRGADRRSIAEIAQIQEGTRRIVAIFDPDVGHLDFGCSQCKPISWYDNKIPKDQSMTYIRQNDINENAFIAVFIFCVIGIIVAVSFLTFNLYHRKSRFIKLSSPNLNNVAVAGCILVYIGITLLGVNDRSVHDHVYTFFCTVRAFIFAAGFSLSFGAMFTKTYRVHQIFTRASHGLIKTKLLKDKQLMLIIGGLLVIDSGVVILWYFVDPMQRKTMNVTTESYDDDPDIIYISQISKCHSIHMEKWLGSFYAFKGLLLIFGVYMAWETRNVKVPILNDSNYIGMNVYNVVIMSAIVVVISNILSDKPTLAFTMESAFMLVSTSVTLCLLFVPKIYTIITANGNPVVATTGILVENKTRRFVVDDRREIYYRAEVQNRVYKRELIELEQEICRLETLLSAPTAPYPVITEEIMYQLPESAVDPSPEFQRKRMSEMEMQRSFSISDGGEVCIGHSEDTSDGTTEPIPRQPVYRERRMSIREVASKKFSDLRRTLSFRPQSKTRKRFESTRLRRKPGDDKEDCLYRAVDKCSVDGIRYKRDVVHQESDGSALSSVEFLTLPSSSYNKPQYSRKDKWRIQIKNQSSDEETVEITNLSDIKTDKKQKLSKKPTAIRHRQTYHQGTYPRRSVDRSASPLSRISTIDVISGSRPLSKSFTYSHILAKERRQRIQKLQSDLDNIQQDLRDLEELEYLVTKV